MMRSIESTSTRRIDRAQSELREAESASLDMQTESPNQALQTTSVTRSGFGKVSVFDRHLLGV